jgi:hypothetical protein
MAFGKLTCFALLSLHTIFTQALSQLHWQVEWSLDGDLFQQLERRGLRLSRPSNYYLVYPGLQVNML